MENSTKNVLITGGFTLIAAAIGTISYSVGKNVQDYRMETTINQSGVITINNNENSIEAIEQILNKYVEINQTYNDQLQDNDNLKNKILENSSLSLTDSNNSLNNIIEQLLDEYEKKELEINNLSETNIQLKGKVDKFIFENQQLKDEVDKLILENQQLKDDANIEIINTSSYFAELGDYKNAILTLCSSTNITSSMNVQIDKYSKEYESQIIAEINNLIIEEKNDDALQVINEALKIIPNSTILNQKKEDIQALKAYYLLDIISPYETRGYEKIDMGEFIQMGGDKFYNGFALGEGWNTSYAIFNLNSKYKVITVMIGHIDGSGERDKTVTIYADDILKETIEIGYQDLPKEFTIDVTGVKKLKFERTDGTTKTGFVDLLIK